MLAIILGVTGLGQKVASIVPNAMKSGIIIGAGIAAVNSVLVDGGRFDQALSRLLPVQVLVFTYCFLATLRVRETLIASLKYLQILAHYQSLCWR